MITRESRNTKEETEKKKDWNEGCNQQDEQKEEKQNRCGKVQ